MDGQNEFDLVKWNDVLYAIWDQEKGIKYTTISSLHKKDKIYPKYVISELRDDSAYQPHS